MISPHWKITRALRETVLGFRANKLPCTFNIQGKNLKIKVRNADDEVLAKLIGVKRGWTTDVQFDSILEGEMVGNDGVFYLKLKVMRILE